MDRPDEAAGGTGPRRQRLRRPVEPRRSAAAMFGFGLVGSTIAILAFPWLLGVVYLVLTCVVVVAALTAVVARRSRLRPIAFVSGWLLPPAAILVFLAIHLGVFDDWVYSHEFDAAAWRASGDSSHTDRTRLRMVEDLRASGRLDGLTREQVVALLGEPSNSGYFAGPDRLVWWSGPDRGIGIDSTWLLVTFGPDGRVSGHGLAED